MVNSVHIVALGARTPVGLTAETSAAAVRAGISRVVLHPFIADQENENVRGGLDGALDAGLLGWQRLTALAQAALHEVTEKLAATQPRLQAHPVLLALPELRPGHDEHDTQRIVETLADAQAKLDRPVKIQLARRGHAGGLEALANAVAEIRRGHEGVYIVGGVDTYFDFDTIDWLQEHRQLKTEETRSAFNPGEAAGFVALAGASTVAKRRLQPLATIRGCGVAHEPKVIKTEAINLGEGLAQAIERAMAELGPSPTAAHSVLCDLNGERYRTEEWGFALLRVPKAVQTSDFVAPVSYWGDVGAATGPLLCSLATRAWARQCARGPRALVCAGSESGLRAAAFLDAPGYV